MQLEARNGAKVTASTTHVLWGSTLKASSRWLVCEQDLWQVDRACVIVLTARMKGNPLLLSIISGVKDIASIMHMFMAFGGLVSQLLSLCEAGMHAMMSSRPE